MQKKYFPKKILKDNGVFVTVQDVLMLLECTKKDIPRGIETVEIEGVGDCISEDHFNKILMYHFPGAQVDAQFTCVKDLAVETRDIVKMYPLMAMIAKETFGKPMVLRHDSLDSYMHNVQYPQDMVRKCEEIKAWGTTTLQGKISGYQETLEDCVPYAELGEFGIEVRTLTEIYQNEMRFHTYLAGKGVFLSQDPETMVDDYWDEAHEEDDGTIIVPSCNCKEGFMRIHPYHARDFCKHDTIDNVIWCVQNIIGKHEWTDSIRLHDFGVSVDVHITLLNKLLNPNSFPGLYFIDGVPDIWGIGK